MATVDHSEFLAQIHYLIGLGKFKQAVEFLNFTSAYRFTALFRISCDRLQNLVVYDREQRDHPTLETIPLGDSYCVFVRDLKDAFIVSNAEADARVEHHPKRPVVHAYCGYPLLDMAGEVCGTVCHFDFAPVPESPETLELLRTFASVFDPALTSDALERGIGVKVDALEAMLGLLAESCWNIDDATAAFEEFASPLRDGSAKLREPMRVATNARIDALLQSLPERYEAKSRRVG